MEKDLVTAIITTYKRNAFFIERAIKSVINQTYSNIEIVIIDDNENNSKYSDDVREICSKYLGIHYYKQDGNKGACAARNLGIKKSKGKYIGFLDDDDEWLPKKIEKQVLEFEKRKNQNVGMIYCKGYLINCEGKTNDLFSINSPLNIDFNMLLETDYIGTTSNPLIKKECFEIVGGFWLKLPARQDYEMWIRISSKYGIVGIDEQLIKHYLHNEEQITKSILKAYIGQRNIFWKYYKYYRKRPEIEKQVVDRITYLGTKANKNILVYKVILKYLRMFKLKEV